MPLTLDGLLRQAGECRRHLEILLDIKKEVDNCFDYTVRHIIDEISIAESVTEAIGYDQIKETIDNLRNCRKIVKDYEECYEKIRVVNEDIDLEKIFKRTSDENSQRVNQSVDGGNTSESTSATTSTPLTSNTKLANFPPEIEFLGSPSKGPAEIRCDKCPRIFKTNGSFATHRKTHDNAAKGKRKFKCEKCSLTYVSKYNLNRHKCNQFFQSVRHEKILDLETIPGLEKILELDPQTEPNPTTQVKQVCNGFTLQYPTANLSIVRPEDKAAGNVWKSVNCSGRYCVTEGRTCCGHCQLDKVSALAIIGSLNEKGLLCIGVERQGFEEVIKALDWNGRRRSVSLAAFYGDRLFSIKCDGSKTTTESNRCELCERMYRTIECLKFKDRIRGNKGAKCLTESEKSLKDQVMEEMESEQRESEASLINAEHIDQGNNSVREQVGEKKKRQQKTKAAIDKSIKRLNRLDVYNPLIAKAIKYEKRFRFKNRSAARTNQRTSTFDVDHGDRAAESVNID